MLRASWSKNSASPYGIGVAHCNTIGRSYSIEKSRKTRKEQTYEKVYLHIIGGMLAVAQPTNRLPPFPSKEICDILLKHEARIFFRRSRLVG